MARSLCGHLAAVLSGAVVGTILFLKGHSTVGLFAALLVSTAGAAPNNDLQEDSHGAGVPESG